MKFDLKLPRWPQKVSEKAPLQPGEIPASLVSSARFAAWMAYGCLVYFLLLYTFDIARDRAAPLHVTHFGLWVAKGDGLEFWFPYICGFFMIAVGIPYVAKIALPVFMSLSWRGNAWPKAWALFIAVSVSLVVFAGTFTIQGDAILEKGRDASVAVAKVEQSKAVLQAQIDAKEAELKSMMENRNAYLAQAASVGATEWQSSYIDRTAANDPQRERIVRAGGAARAADALRSEISRLRVVAASSTTIAAVQERVTPTAGTSWIASAIDYIQGIRAILLSLVMDIVALLMPWIALRLGQSRNGQREAFDRTDVLSIEDHTEDGPLPTQPMDRSKVKRERFVDGETGEVMYRVPEFTRRMPKGKKGKRKNDKTEYEAPATVSRLNEENGDVDSRADDDSQVLDGDTVVGVDVSPSLSLGGQALTPSEPEEMVDASVAAERNEDAAVQTDRPEDISDGDGVRKIVSDEAAPLEIITKTVSDEEFAAEYEAGRITADGYEIPDPAEAVELEDESPRFPALTYEGAK